MRAEGHQQRQAPGTCEDVMSWKLSQQLKRAVDWVFHDAMFADLKRHGNATWNPRLLVALVVLTAWCGHRQLRDSFQEAAKLSGALFGDVALATYQGMTRAIVSYGSQLLPMVWLRLQSLMAQVAPEHYRIGQWLPLAVDGSRFTTPRTASNERAFATKNFGKGGRGSSRRKWKNKKRRSKKLCHPVKPQIWLTLVWHMGTKLPWCWKHGASTSSERHHLMDIVSGMKFPEKTLFCCDAGFTGYELWSTFLNAGHNFLVRVGGNINLLQELGHCRKGRDIVCLWPSQAARKQQPPIVLRLVEVKGERGSMFLVTSILDRKTLSDSMLKKLYPLRWGVELQFRSLKQTFSLGTLRSRNSENTEVELDWSIVALTVVQLLALKEQSKLDIPPEQSSVRESLRAIQYAIRHWHEKATADESLFDRLADATKDNYTRAQSKAARYRPKYKHIPTAGKPMIKKATDKQKHAYEQLHLAC